MWKGSVIVGCSTAAACIMVLSVFCELRPLGGAGRHHRISHGGNSVFPMTLSNDRYLLDGNLEPLSNALEEVRFILHSQVQEDH